MAEELAIREMAADDPPVVAEAFRAQGWNKPQSQYETYLREQAAGTRTVLIACSGGRFVGYLTIVWSSGHAGFRSRSIPEIVDLNVLIAHRRRGYASALMDEAESRICRRSPVAGIGVGMTADYGPAQVMYARRGYVPDGTGLHYDGRQLGYGETATVDDSLNLYLTRQL